MNAAIRPSGRARLPTRLGRLEATFNTQVKVSIHDEMDRWTERFTRSSEARRDLVARITARGTIYAAGIFHRDGGTTHAGLMLMSLMYQSPSLNNNLREWERIPIIEVPDHDVAEALLIEYINAMGEYQVETGDWWNAASWGIAELGRKVLAQRTNTLAEEKAPTLVEADMRVEVV